MRLPIDTTTLSLLVASRPEPVRDLVTMHQKVDAHGRPVFVVQLFVVSDDSADLVAVEVPGRIPAAVRPGSRVTVTRLTAIPWRLGARTGLGFRADRVEPDCAQP